MRGRDVDVSGRLRRADPSIFYVLAAVFALVILIWGFAEITEEVMDGHIHAIDTMVLRLLRREDDITVPIGPGWLLSAARDITALGSHAVLTLITLIAGGYCWLIRRFVTAALIVVAAGGGGILTVLLKWLVERARPDIVPHLVEVSSMSYPSGHAMVSAAVYLSLGVTLAQVTPGHRTKLYIIGSALLLTGLVGLSRIYFGVHYPSDVIAGWAIGLSWALLCWLLIAFLSRDKSEARAD